MTKAQEATLDAIRAFKKEGTTDLEAALNVLASHAATIQSQIALLRDLRSALDDGYFFVTRGPGRDAASALLDRLNEAVGDQRSEKVRKEARQ